jgi:predicted enzyme related to lactoylglutathione lyase
MSVITAHAAGTFCWPELNTTDVAAAKSFYSALFGWASTDSPIPQGGVYTMLKLAGQDVGAMSTLQDDQRQAGVPPHWMSYVAVENADETAKAAAALGGTVMAGPFDVTTAGRMAVIQDPTGAMFCIWEPKEHPGATRIDEVGALAWTELSTKDVDKAAAFYSSLFKWRPKPWESPNPYTVFHLAGEERMAAGMLQTTDEMGEVPPHWLPYFQVDDTDRIVSKAEQLGATVHMPATDFPNVGRLAVIADPQGAMFAVIKVA